MLEVMRFTKACTGPNTIDIHIYFDDPPLYFHRMLSLIHAIVYVLIPISHQFLKRQYRRNTNNLLVVNNSVPLFASNRMKDRMSHNARQNQ